MIGAQLSFIEDPTFTYVAQSHILVVLGLKLKFFKIEKSKHMCSKVGY